MNTTRKMRFHPGTILASPDAQEVLSAGGTDPQELIYRHVIGDWDPSMEADLIAVSERAIAEGGVVVSTWQLGGYTLWIRTDAARETTILDIPLDN